MTTARERREEWMRQAAARWRHLPTGTDNERAEVARLTLETFREIESEWHGRATALPTLTRDEHEALLDQATLAVCREYIVDEKIPEESMQAVIDAAIDQLYRLLCLGAREQKATPEVRAELWQRRVRAAWWGK